MVRPASRYYWPAILPLVAVLSGGIGGRAASLVPFYLIERYLKVGILLHFDTEEMRRYDVQCTTNFAATLQPVDVLSAEWTTIYSVEPFPFTGHYILFEPTTNAPAVRFYRIVATP